MIQFLARRFLLMIPTLFVISVISFIIIELPPGDFLTTYIQKQEDLHASGISEEIIAGMEQRWGLDRPWYWRYLRWITNFVQGDLGFSLDYMKPVNEIIGERLILTMVVSLASLLFAWGMAIPIGVYSAVRQYSTGDYILSFLGFIGLAVPNFMLALVLMYLSYSLFDASVGGLFSREYLIAQWSLGKVIDLLKHLWIPMIVVGTAGTASTIRVMRANLLDELRKNYVVAARVGGLKETALLVKYPIRVAINPLISTIGWLLPTLISGATITAVVLGLPTVGPVFLRALQVQDMYLAGSVVMLLATATVIGTVLSDILLAAIDPRIRFD
jgi:peptide/nickel transport system permease protein